MIERSDANEDEIDTYTNGECHVFAAALHRKTGWPFLMVLDAYGSPWGNDEQFLPNVVHVFCLDPNGNAWDIKGARPYSDVYQEMIDWIPVNEYEDEHIPSESELSKYIQFEDDGSERPLASYGEKCIGRAQEVMEQAFRNLDLGQKPQKSPGM